MYIVTNGKKESYYFSDYEFDQVRGKIKGTITRAKGLGALNEKVARASMFGDCQKMDVIESTPESLILLEELMGVDVEPRREFVFNKIDFSEVRE